MSRVTGLDAKANFIDEDILYDEVSPASAQAGSQPPRSSNDVHYLDDAEPRQLLINGENPPPVSDEAGVPTCTANPRWQTRGAQPCDYGLPPVLLVLSPDCEISVLDLASWGTSPIWSTPCQLNGSLGSMKRPIATGVDRRTRQPTLPCHGPATAHVEQHTDVDNDNLEVLPPEPGTSPCATGLQRRSSHPSIFTPRPGPGQVRSVTVARIVGHCLRKSGPYGTDSPAASSSTSTGRSCLRPSRTWPTESAAQGESRPVKTVRWLDHVALEAVAAVQSASLNGPPNASEEHEAVSPGAAAPPPRGTGRALPFVMKSEAAGKSCSESAPTALAGPPPLHHLLESLDTVAIRDEPSLPLCSDRSSAPQPSSSLGGNGNGNVDDSAAVQPAVAVSSLPASLPSPSSPSSAMGAIQQRSPSLADLPLLPLPQRRQLHRLLSPQMLLALEHSQPISEVHTFTRSCSSELAIVPVQRYDTATHAGGEVPLELSCRVPAEWLGTQCYSVGAIEALSDDVGCSGLISVLDSLDGDGDCCGDPCAAALDGALSTWGADQQPPAREQGQQIDGGDRQGLHTSRPSATAVAPAAADATAAGPSRRGSCVGGGPPSYDERSLCGASCVYSTQTCSTTSCSRSFCFGASGLLDGGDNCSRKQHQQQHKPQHQLQPQQHQLQSGSGADVLGGDICRMTTRARAWTGGHALLRTPETTTANKPLYDAGQHGDIRPAPSPCNSLEGGEGCSVAAAADGAAVTGGGAGGDGLVDEALLRCLIQQGFREQEQEQTASPHASPPPPSPLPALPQPPQLQLLLQQQQRPLRQFTGRPDDVAGSASAWGLQGGAAVSKATAEHSRSLSAPCRPSREAAAAGRGASATAASAAAAAAEGPQAVLNPGTRPSTVPPCQDNAAGREALAADDADACSSGGTDAAVAAPGGRGGRAAASCLLGCEVGKVEGVGAAEAEAGKGRVAGTARCRGSRLEGMGPLHRLVTALRRSARALVTCTAVVAAE